MSDHEKYVKYKRKYISLKKARAQQKGGQDTALFPIADEICFWGRQMAEHAMILFLGLQDKNGELKKKAFQLFQKWNHYMDKNFYEKGILVNEKTVFLTQEDLSKIGNVSTEKTNEIIEETINFKKEIIKILEEGKWIGWVYVSLAKHMLSEAEYFKRKVNGPAYSRKEEIDFCNHHNSDEMGATAQLIDPQPDQQMIIDIVRSYAMKRMANLKAGQSLSNAENEPFPKQWTFIEQEILQGLAPSDETNLLMISIKFGMELVEFAEDTGKKIASNQLKSIIPLFLAHHVLREFTRFTETLRRLQ